MYSRLNVLLTVTSVMILLLCGPMIGYGPSNEAQSNAGFQDHELSGPPATGNWIIDNETTLVGQTLEINGQVVIVSGGHLTLQSCVVTMNSQIDWYPHEQVCRFAVFSGGYLTLLDTDISSGTDYRWYITADGGAGVDIQDCTLEGNFPKPDPLYHDAGIISCGLWPSYEPLEYAIIKNNVIRNYEGGGIGVHADKAEVIDNVISNIYMAGITVMASPRANVTGNVIDNVIDDGLAEGEHPWAYGIRLDSPVEGNISYNTITNVDALGFEWRIDTWTPPVDMPSLRAFDGNTVDGDSVLFVQSEDSVTIGNDYREVIANNCTNLEIRDFRGASLAVSYSPGVTIENCTPSISGISVAFSDNARIAHNVIDDVWHGDAVSLMRATGGLIYNNTMSVGSEYSGNIAVRWASDIVIRQNYVFDAFRWGISIMDSEYCLVEDNRMVDSGQQGIVVWRSPRTVVTRNIVDGITGSSRPYAIDLYIGLAGIDIEGSDGSTISENTIMNTISDGIWVDYSNDVEVFDNSISNLPGRGIFFESCRGVVILDNDISNATWAGLGFWECTNVTVERLTMNDIRGSPLYWHNRFVSHRFAEFQNVTYDGRPIELYQDSPGISIGLGLAGAVLINCSGATVHNMEGNSLSVAHSPNVVVRDSEITGGSLAISYSDNTTVAKCVVGDNPFLNLTYNWGWISFGQLGMGLWSCDNSLILANEVNNSGVVGIDAFHCVPLEIIGNAVTHSKVDGIVLWNTRDAVVTANTVNNTVGNSIKLDRARRIEVYLNCFGPSEGLQANILDSSEIQWDNGTYGNYWSNYTGEDSDSNGIGDSPYEIDIENEDRFPLMDSSLVQSHKGDLFSYGPDMTGATLAPELPTTIDNVTVNVNAAARYGVALVVLSYSTDGGLTWTNLTMSYVDGEWRAILTQLPASQVMCKVFVMDNLGNWIVRDLDTFEVAASFDPVPLGIVSVIGIIGIAGVVVILKRR
ncbi:MAG: right-handed parallel beta-helix repeat-containing protein [Candidatus Thorarchaeota archaeon]